jgi:hypothetical protein
MPTDSFFTQGSSHKICQDYAIHINDCVIVSDGCSSAEDTDFGARLLARAALQTVKQGVILGIDAFYHRVLATAVGYCQSLGLDRDCLFATLLIAQRTREDGLEGVAVSINGDGAVVVKRKSGLIEVTQYEFPFEAPFYLRYHLDKMWKHYKEQVATGYTVQTYQIEGNEIKNFQTFQCPVKFDQLGMGYHYYHLTKENDPIETVAIMSDGVSKFLRPQVTTTQRQMVGIDTAAIISPLMEFKGFQGEFVQRRCKMAFRAFDKNQWKPFDDFSIGVIAVEEHE